MKNNVIIMAAGKSRRMKSKTSKVLHPILGKRVIEYVLDLAEGAGGENIVLVVSPEADEVIKALENRSVTWAVQKEQRGTGDAVAAALPHLEEGPVLILCGDAPCLKPETLKALFQYHEEQGNDLSILSVQTEKPYGYGRILREAGRVVDIREERDCTETEREVTEINSGVFLIDGIWLKKYLPRLTNDNAQGEYYITSLVELMREDHVLGALCIADEEEIIGINDRQQLSIASAIMQRRINDHWMKEGVTMLQPESIFIDAEVVLAEDVTLLPGTILRGRSAIEEGAVIGPQAYLENCHVAAEAEIRYSTLHDSTVGSRTKVGPYTYVRPGSHIGCDCKVGDFVEVKNSTIGDGTKISHLSYVGDGDVGDHVNIACGVVFVNYDGMKKHRTRIEDHAFIGCNANLVAPVTIGEGAYVAAGTTVTEEVPPYGLCIGRSRQNIKAEWARNKIKRK